MHWLCCMTPCFESPSLPPSLSSSLPPSLPLAPAWEAVYNLLYHRHSFCSSQPKMGSGRSSWKNSGETRLIAVFSKAIYSTHIPLQGGNMDMVKIAWTFNAIKHAGQIKEQLGYPRKCMEIVNTWQVYACPGCFDLKWLCTVSGYYWWTRVVLPLGLVLVNESRCLCIVGAQYGPL